MIPKKIHYCWFGGAPLPPLAEKCIQSWRQYCPDYEIIEWNETNFDVNCNSYVREAYEARKWAFVSDYARFQVLFEQGGLYFDTDVELIKNIDHIVKTGSFMGCETVDTVNPGLGLAAVPGMPLYKELLDSYEAATFFKEDGSQDLTTVVERTTDILRNHGFTQGNKCQTVCGIDIYPIDYFNPMDMNSGKVTISENTVSIHHFMASWCDPKAIFRGKIYRLLYRVFGRSAADTIRKIFGK